MWTYVLIVGVGMLMDPVRIGIAALLMSRRRAIVTLLAFWVGGMVAGVTVGIAVLVLLHDVALVGIEAAVSTINDIRSAVIILTGEHLRITLGVLALVGLAVMLARDRARSRMPVAVGAGETVAVGGAETVAVGGGKTVDVLPTSRKPKLSAVIATRTHGLLDSGLIWPAFIVGLMSTFPPIEGPMVLTVIMGSRAAAGAQFSAFILFTLLVLAFIEIPLVSYLAAPEKTETAMLRMNNWITAHRRQIVEAMLGVTGALLTVQGVISL